jgi:hypothetical protein
LIIEGIVTTLNEDGSLNIAPMGPRLVSGFERFVLRPFQTSTTFANLLRVKEGVLHVTDDALLFARTAVGIAVEPATRPAEAITGRILADTCRYFEFRIRDVDHSEARATLTAETVASGRIRDFIGFNRARHAVIEAAVLATRAEWLPVSEMSADLARHRTIVEKTGGPDEHLAIALLVDHVRRKVEARSESWPTSIA